MANLLRCVCSATRVYGKLPGNNVRFASTLSLKDVVREKIPEKRELLKKLRSKEDISLGEVTIGSAVGGMRGLKVMLWEGSVLDPDEGIRFHGMTIPDCQEKLPKGKTGREMLPESMFWLLLTGEVPTEEQVRGLSQELAERVLNTSTKPDLRGVQNTNVHPMVRLSTGVLALSDQSEFSKAYIKGMKKTDHWESSIFLPSYSLMAVYEDAMNLLAWLPTVAAYSLIQPSSVESLWQRCGDMTKNDWCKNFAFMLDPKKAASNEDFVDLIRLYVALHGDHEGGNVSAHASHLVGSALSDAFLSYSAALNGLHNNHVLC
jgi:citrate synthase